MWRPPPAPEHDGPVTPSAASDAEPRERSGVRADTPAARATYHHGDLRRALLEAGTDLAREGGPDKVVLREATRRAGVSANAAYRHFADRDALLGEVVSRAQARAADVISATMDAVPDDLDDRPAGAGPASGPSASATCASPWTSRACSARRSPCPSTSAGPRRRGGRRRRRTPFQLLSDSLDAMVDGRGHVRARAPGRRAARVVGRARHGDARTRGAAARPAARRRRRARPAPRAAWSTSGSACPTGPAVAPHGTAHRLPRVVA